MPCSLLRCECGNHYFAHRYVMAIMSLLAITLCYNHRVCLNLAINYMVKPIKSKAKPFCPKDPTKNKTIEGDLRDWDMKIQGYTKSTFYIGYVGLHIPGGILSDTYGGRISMLTSTIISTICCFVTPLSVFVGDWWLLCIMRVIMGSAQALLFPAVSALLANWVPKKQRSFLSTLAFSGSHVGTIVGSSFSGYIIDYMNSWPVVYYFWAAVTVPWIVIAFFLIFSTPNTHPFVTEQEKAFLEETIPKKSSKKIPWKAICGDIHIWAIVIGQLGHSWMFFTLNTDLPNYLKNMMGYDIKANGVLSAMPFLGMWICSVLSGKIADVLVAKGVRVVTVRRGSTIIGNVVASALLILVPFMGCNRVMVTVITVGAMCLKAPYYCGVRINHLDISVHFAGILNAFVNGLGSISGFVTPYVIGVVAKDQTIGQWRIVFFLNLAVSSTFTLIYVIFASGERAEWDKEFDEAK